MKKIAKGLIVVLFTIIGGQYGCGGQEHMDSTPPVDLVVSNQSISGRFDRDRLSEAVRRENPRPLKLMFEATDKVTGQTAWPEIAISGIYDGQKFKGIRVSLKSGRSIDLVPRSLISLIGKSVIFDVYDDQGSKVADPVVVKLTTDQLPANRADLDAIGRWLIGVGAVALAIALPALLVAGVFGVALAVTVGVARVIGSLIWAVFQLGLAAAAVGFLLAIVQIAFPEATADGIKGWLSSLWQKIVIIGGDLLKQAQSKITPAGTLG